MLNVAWASSFSRVNQRKKKDKWATFSYVAHYLSRPTSPCMQPTMISAKFVSENWEELYSTICTICAELATPNDRI